MDFIDQIKHFSSQVKNTLPQITTEEATKQALILPFLQILGYNVFCPTEVIPEFTADVGIKKGERVDYAIKVNGQLCILIEAKPCTESLENHDSQLFRYFAATQAKFAILTNGVLYKFYTDLQKNNKMDLEPFLEFNVLEPKESLIPNIRQFHKEKYNADDLTTIATNLLYRSKIMLKLEQEMKDPSKEMLKHFLWDVHSGSLTQQVIEKYRPIVKDAFAQYINEKINERLQTAMNSIENEKQQKEAAAAEELLVEEKPKVVTTEEEIEAFYIIKSILRGTVDPNRLSYKDTASYFAILLDGKSNDWICRLSIKGNKNRLYLPACDDSIQFSTLDELYNYSENIIMAAKRQLED